MSQTYSFPVLSDQELLPCLKEMDMPLTAAQLAKPSYELVKPIYESLVTTLMGVSREELQQPVFAAIDVLEFPELHDESIPFMAFTKCLTQLMVAAGVKDFSLQDICKPETTRLRRNLSAIINFAKFREEKLVPYTEMQEQTIVLLEETEELENTNCQLMEELQGLQAEREAEKPEVAAIEAASQEIYAENQQLNKQQIALNNEARALKQQTNTLTNEAANEKFKLQNARQEAEKLRGLIVESPEKLAAALKDLQVAIDRERALTSEAERRARDLQTKLDTIAKVEKEVQKAMGTMGEVDTEIARKKEASKQVKALRAQIHSHETEAAQLTAQQQHLQRQRASLSERLQRLEHQSELRKEAAVSAVEEQRKNKEAIEAENAANIAKLTENDAAMRSLREKIKEMQSSHEAQIGIVLEKFQMLRNQISEYHETLEAAMVLPEHTGAVRAITLR